MQSSTSKQNWKHLIALSVGALGVVYGDIGTSPLYAIKEIFYSHEHIAHTHESILGVMSLVFWALTIIVAIKYVLFVLRADNEGEGGVFALYGLLDRHRIPGAVVLGSVLILAAGLLFGDGVITPAISVISAVEGLSVVTSSVQPYIVGITIAILTGLFAIQQFGTDKIGKLFGPIIALWFTCIATLGLVQVVQHPEVLAAINPYYAFHLLTHLHLHSLFLILGSVMLVVTGGEAMYADMGHFGRRPIRLSWFTLTYPALLLNYFGQGAYLLSGKEVIAETIFFSMVPHVLLVPMIILATLATIIASQALITGAFSLASQAVSLGLLPLLKVKYTHQDHSGQIYMPLVNWLLYAGCIALVFTFKSSTNLAGAYGLAVSGVMVATTLSMIQIAKGRWHWKPWVAHSFFGALVLIDVTFLVANSMKILQGGYVPLAIGVSILVIMKTWQWGQRHIGRVFAQIPSMTIKELVTMKSSQETHVPRTVVVISHEIVGKTSAKVPFIKQIFWERYGLLSQHIVFVNVLISKNDPYCASERYKIKEFYHDKKQGSIYAVQVKFGFMEEPNVESVLEGIAKHREVKIDHDPQNWLIHVAQEKAFLSREATLVRRFFYGLFMLLHKNAQTYTQFFELGKAAHLTAESVPVKF